MTSPLWQLDQVRLGGQANQRLHVETLAVCPGVTAVLGESGAGKTSLLNLLVGFEAADAGTIQAAESLPAMAWVPADFGLWAPFTAQEHLEAVLPASATNSDSAFDWLIRFQLEHLSQQRPAQLSMGERSRLAVARALATGAEVVVMDEPLVHVDTAHLLEYWNIIRETITARNGSLIFSTHAPEFVLRHAETVICLNQGRVTWQGAVQTLYQTPPTRELASVLGQTNWLEPESARFWLQHAEETALHVRPEQLRVETDADGPFAVQTSHCLGTQTETELIAPNTQQQHSFIHVTTHSLQPGMRVALRLLLCCALWLSIVMTQGCQKTSGAETELEVIKSRHRALPVEEAMMPAPRGMTYSPEGELFVLDNAGRMVVYDAEGEFSRKWWMPEYDVGKPEGAWVLLDGRIAVADTHYHRVLFFDQQGTLLGQFGENGRGPGQFIYVIAVTQDPHGFIYVAENGGNDRIQKFTAEGEFVCSIGACGVEPGEFQRPSGVVWRDGELIVADAINNRVQVFKDDGTFVKIIADAESAGLYYPYDIAQAPDGSLFLPEYGAGRISQLSAEGKLLARYGREGRGLGEFWTPWGIAVSNTGEVAVADTGNRRIVELQLQQFRKLLSQNSHSLTQTSSSHRGDEVQP